METPNKETVLNVAIGQRIFELLNLKITKAGRIKTSWGDKTVEGLGATISRITEEENERLKDYDTPPSKEYARDEILKICRNMRRFGGSFIVALSETIMRADTENTKKLQSTFADEFKRYLEI